MNRQTFFKDSQTSLLKTKSWSVKVAKRIMNNHVQFELPTSMYSSYKNVTKDISVQLMPCDANPELWSWELFVQITFTYYV